MFWLSDQDPPDVFPPVENALKDPDGLLAAGGDLSPERLLAAYRRGIFPWYSRGQPILWWSPDPRAVLIPSELKISRSFSKTLRAKDFSVQFDTAFALVMNACGDRKLRPEGTWISLDMRRAYTRLHELGYAHSVEVYLDAELVGGLYGVALGKVFFGESMFSRVSDASKVALKNLCDQLVQRNFALIDCQMATPHLMSLGAKTIPRSQFNAVLAAQAQPPDPVGPWQ
ncbi:MAG: leucyl/phenylalanyl-tRNA--protein transferase [Candidatus Obscuribacterales bacterium]|nr:leucyl/phenylalanyl-tRNA--protein transferase [Steroidobacteraceae bacterium]